MRLPAVLDGFDRGLQPGEITDIRRKVEDEPKDVKDEPEDVQNQTGEGKKTVVVVWAGWSLSHRREKPEQGWGLRLCSCPPCL